MRRLLLALRATRAALSYAAGICTPRTRNVQAGAMPEPLGPAVGRAAWDDTHGKGPPPDSEAAVQFEESLAPLQAQQTRGD
jgi:hypothetical protein